jgi:hypothetical protein
LRKIRAVIDTNIFVSGAISPKGSPRRILEIAERKVSETVTSPLINQEILSVLHRENTYAKYGINEDIVDGIASFLYEGTILTQGFCQVTRIKQDPEDNKFIGCAVEGEADYIVSGDRHLLSLKSYKGIQILNADSFLRVLVKKTKGK